MRATRSPRSSMADLGAVQRGADARAPPASRLRRGQPAAGAGSRPKSARQTYPRPPLRAGSAHARRWRAGTIAVRGQLLALAKDSCSYDEMVEKSLKWHHSTMALNIKDKETEELAAEIASPHGGEQDRSGASRRCAIDAIASRSKWVPVGRKSPPGSLLRFLETEIWPQIPEEPAQPSPDDQSRNGRRFSALDRRGIDSRQLSPSCRCFFRRKVIVNSPK